MTFPLPRIDLAGLPASVHGGADPVELARLGLTLADVLDFSANLNPFVPMRLLREAAASVDPSTYPDRESAELRTALGRRHRVTPEEIIAGNGSLELIHLAAIAFAGCGRNVAVLGPTFDGYARAAKIAGAEVTEVRAQEETGFAPPVAAFEELLATTKPVLAFLCNPNSPTGQELRTEEIVAMTRSHPAILFVLDEAYVDCIPDRDPATVLRSPNLLVIRSLTKAFGLAGLRLGFALGPPEIIAALRAVQPSWSVNRVAQAVGVAVLREGSLLQEAILRWCAARDDLAHALIERRWTVTQSRAPFFMVNVGNAAACRSALLERRMIVRDCASFGLPGWIRVSPRGGDADRQLVAALQEWRERR